MATGYSISGGSTTVAAGVATAAFIVSSDGGTFSGGERITITVTGGTVTVSGLGSVINNTTAAATAVMDIDGSSFTFTVTWSTAGTKSIVYTNNQAWANPSNGSVTVTGLGSPAFVGSLIGLKFGF